MERARVERDFEEALERIDARIAALRAMTVGLSAADAAVPQIGVLEQQALDAHMRLARMRARHGGWESLRGQLEADIRGLDGALQHWVERLSGQPGTRIVLS